MELTAIPGIGEKTATALSSLDDPEGALAAGNVAAIAQAPGVTPGRAARIVRAAIKARHGDDGEFLATDRARRIYRDVLDLVQERAHTTYGTHRLETFFPTGNRDRIEEAQARTRQALEHAPDLALDGPLSRLRPLEAPRNLRIRDRCIATGQAERYERTAEAFPELSIEIIEDTRSIADLARGYARVIVIDEAYAGLDLDDNVEVVPEPFEESLQIIPERTLSWYAQNRTSIEAAIAVHRTADLDPPTELDELERLLGRVDDNGMPAGDAERDRLATALDDLDVSVEMARKEAEDRLREAISERDVTVDGTDLLSMAEQGAGVESLLTRELADEYDDALDRAREHLVDALGLTDGEATHVQTIFPDEPTFPVVTNEDAVERLRADLRVAHDRRATHLLESLASDLSERREHVETLVTQALELDVDLAIAQFAADFSCTMPTFDGDGFAIEGGRSPLLGVPIDEVDPVAYDVDGVALLSGVNSGGKTSLLELVAATTILAHMGLPVPAADVRVQRFDSIHYHGATQGTLDAGAFEATVTQFADIATGDGERLVLVDELESITEPGAAAIIVGGILEELQDEVTAVFVTHLAKEIMEVSDVDIRVDGIAARGVEDGELVVDRTPVRDHLARSTPELIVEQLATTNEGPEAAVYDRLLEKF